MSKSLFLVDFHTHLLPKANTKLICPEDQESAFFRYIVPVLEPVAHFSEPLHDQFLRYLAMHYNNALGRQMFRAFGHVFLMEALRLFKRYGMKELIHSMDKQGISHAVVYSLEPLTKTQEILDITEPYRDRISVFASVNNEIADRVGYLAPFVESGAVRGIKIHPQVGGYSRDDIFEATKDVITLAAEYRLPVCFHTGHIPVEALSGIGGNVDVKSIEPLIKAYPSCTIVLNHIGWESWREVLKIAVKYENVMVETSWQPAHVVRRAVKTIGAQRVLFGSDYPLFQQWQALRDVRRALARKDFEQVASLNAVRLLGLSTKAQSRA
ncbi:MAG: amidohydrolase family protein [Candidatus Melainabacteria bacterium]|nr:amidohydrolase family protein [Candidatus Melainabacteria bacterium]